MNNVNFPYLEDVNNTFEGLIFDLDGTLLDSMTLWNQVDIDFLAQFNIEVTKDYTDYVKSVSIDDAAEYTRKRYNLSMTSDEIKNWWISKVSYAYAHDVSIFDGVYDYLKTAHELGLKITTATALTRDNAVACLKNNNIYQFFDSLITLEDLDGINNKSQPDIFIKAAESIGLTYSACLVYEDVPMAISGAKLGGFKTCAVYDLIGAGSKDCWDEMISSSDFAIVDWNLTKKQKN